MRKVQTLLAIFVLGLVVLGTAAPAVAAYPEKPIEFVTHSAPGGGSDIFARRVADIAAQQKIFPVPLVVVNKPGGSGAVATGYVATKKDEPYMIFATTVSIYTTLAKGEVKVSLADYTPICALIQDPNILAVRTEAPYKNVKEFIAAAKQKRKGLNQGLASLGATDHILSHRIQKATGAEFNIVSFKQGTEANMALLGGHVDFGLGNPSEMAGQMEAGKLRALATATEKRLPYLPKVPTLKEEGIDVSIAQIRGIWGTKNMPKEAVQYLETAFNRLTKTEAWKKYLADEMVLDSFMGNAEYTKWLDKELKNYTQELTELGLIKKK